MDRPSEEVSASAERAAVERLVNDYFKLAVKIARRMGAQFPWLSDDFESEAGLALLKAVRTRHAYRGKFETLVHWHVVRNCLQLVESERKRPDSRFNSVDVEDSARREYKAPGRGGGGDANPKQGSCSGLPDDAPAAAVMTDLLDLLERLPEKRREAIRRHFFDGESWEELGAERGVSRQAVGQMAERDLAKLRRAAEGSE